MQTHKTLTKDGYNVNIKKLKTTDVAQITNDLTVKPNKLSDYVDKIDSFEVFKKNGDILTLPTHYGIEKFGQPTELLNLENSKINIQFKGNLRPHQIQVVEAAIKGLKTKGGGILALPTGFGKTTLALYIASQLKLKTLVIVHKTFLQNQWYERIKQFTDARIGIIRQKKTDVENKDIVIGMLQSISMIDYDKSIFKDFNLIIVDECHHAAAKVFSQAFFKLGSKYTLGLSATPTRQDGLTKVLKWFLGDIIVQVSKKGDKNVYVNMFNYDSDDKLYTEKKRWFKGKVKPDIQKMITNMYKIEKRNKFVSNIITSLRNKDERKILVLSDRIEHLNQIKKLVDDKIVDDVSNGLHENEEIKTAYYIGKMKDYELKDAEEADIIFGTYPMAEEGLDISGLNTVIFATPKKNIIQSIGRIMRRPLEEGDINPLVIDIVDNIPSFKNWAEQRLKYYTSKKYTVSTYNAYNENCVTPQDLLRSKGEVVDSDNFKEQYIRYMYGNDYYELEKDIGFESFDDKILNYNPDLDAIFDLAPISNNDLENTDVDEYKIKIII